MKKPLLLILILSFSLILTSCKEPNIEVSCFDDPTQEFCSEQLRSGSYFSLEWLDTISNINYYTYDSDVDFTGINNEIDNILETIQNNFDVHDENSTLSLINQKAGIEAVSVDQSVIDLVTMAKDFAQVSNGKFDPTIGSVARYWNITDKLEIVNEGGDVLIPTEEEMVDIVALVDYTKVVIDDENNTIYLEDEGMQLDLGGIAKGYAADKVKEYLVLAGIDYGLINLGGNIQSINGHYSGSRDWSLGIRDPYKTASFYFCIVELNNSTLVSSGVYERSFLYNDILYHHIMDTSTGFPVDNELVAVSILTNDSAYADGLSTMLFAMGLEEGFTYAQSQTDFNALFVTYDKEVYVTSGIVDGLKEKSTDYTFYTDLDKTPLN